MSTSQAELMALMTTETTEQFLLLKYGPLLTLAQAAEFLDRSAEGLRISIRGQTEFAKKMRAAQRRLGRRVYFKTNEVAKLVETGA